MTQLGPDRNARPLSGDEREVFRVASLIAVHHMPYLAGVLYNLRPVAAPGLRGMGVDTRWRLYVDVDHVATWSPERQATALLHEAGHLLRQHARRAIDVGVTDPVGHHRIGPRDGSNRERWNLASDLSVNQDLSGPRGTALDLPHGWLRPGDLGMPDGLTTEQYYEMLAAGGSRPPAPDLDDGDVADEETPDDGQRRDGEPVSCGSGAGGAPLAWEFGEDLMDGNLMEDDTASDGTTVGVSESEADLIRREAALRIAEHADSHGRGSVPAGMQRWATEVLAPPAVDWRRELSAAVRRATAHAAGQVDYTYRRPSRRRIPGVILPSMHQPRPKVVTLVDTSGSMTPKALATALAEVDGICRHAGLRGQDHRLMTVDSRVQDIQPVRRASDVTLQGGGGTDMRVGLQRATTLRPRPDVIIVMTDGLTPWPQSAPRGITVVVVLITSGTSPRPPAWSHVVEIPVSAVAA